MSIRLQDDADPPAGHVWSRVNANIEIDITYGVGEAIIDTRKDCESFHWRVSDMVSTPNIRFVSNGFKVLSTYDIGFIATLIK